MSGEALAGCKVLVTRPVAQADSLCAAIEAAGGTAIRFPVIQIAALPADNIAAELATIPEPDIAVFVSRNAVEYGAAHFAGYAGQVAAIGRATASALAQNDLPATIDPGEGFTSEQLLAHTALQDVSGQTVVIVRGADGRTLLRDTLTARGANVHYLSVYAREPAALPQAAVDELDREWQAAGIDVVSVMSVATFEALVGALPAASLQVLQRTPLVAPGERVIQTIGKLVPGIPAIQASGPHPEDIVSALIEWRHSGTS